MHPTKQGSLYFFFKRLTDALSNVLSPTPIAKTGRPWKRRKGNKYKSQEMTAKMKCIEKGIMSEK